MERKTKIIIGIVSALVLIGGGIGVWYYIKNKKEEDGLETGGSTENNTASKTVLANNRDTKSTLSNKKVEEKTMNRTFQRIPA